MERYTDRDRLLELIADVDRRKRAARKIPVITLRIPAKMTLGWSDDRIDRVAAQLQESGDITIGRTIRDTYYKLNH